MRWNQPHRQLHACEQLLADHHRDGRQFYAYADCASKGGSFQVGDRKNPGVWWCGALLQPKTRVWVLGDEWQNSLRDAIGESYPRVDGNVRSTAKHPDSSGLDDERWDLVVLVRQSSVQSFLAFANHREYLVGLGHRTAAIEDSRLLPMTELPIPA